MYIALMGCAQQGSAAPLAASVDGASLVDAVDVIGSQTGSVVTFTNQGGFDATIVATGGSGVYTYSWAVTKTVERSDTNNRFSINTTGTTNAARYNTLTVDGARPPTSVDAQFDATFEATCTVDDGASTVDVIVQFTCQGITTP